MCLSWVRNYKGLYTKRERGEDLMEGGSYRPKYCLNKTLKKMSRHCSRTQMLDTGMSLGLRGTAIGIAK